MSSTGKAQFASDIADEIRSFFGAFCNAFCEFNGAVIAKRFAVPYTALNAEGRLQVFGSHEQISQYFQGFLDKYHEQGCRTCQFKELEVVLLGQASALASLTWELLDRNSSVVTSWRESYNLTRIGDELLIYGSTDHV